MPRKSSPEQRHYGEAAAFDGACRAGFLSEAGAPEHAVTNHVGQAFQHVDAHHARAADAIAAYAIEALGRRTVEAG